TMSDSASSGGSNILSLNSYCLYNIFRRIKINCENAHNAKDTLGKYLDLMNFAISCDVFTKTFKEWNTELYEDLRLTLDFSNRGPLIKVNLSNLYKNMHKQSEKEQKLFWSAYLNAIKENVELESVKLSYKPAQYYHQHLDRFEALLNALKVKRTLRQLDISIKGYSFENVEIEGLETLHLDARMDVSDLVQLCHRNPNLRRLKLTSAELSGRLSDIVPYCSRLEYLTISMKDGLDAAEYAPLAKLPQLRDLTLLGEPVEGSLLKLFQALEETLIQQISIPNVFITNEEQYALSKIVSLNSIKCCPRDSSPDLHLLYNPINLKKTYRLFRPQKNPDHMDLEIVKYRIRACVSAKKITSPETAMEIGFLLNGYSTSEWFSLLHAYQFYVEGWITADDLGLLPESYSTASIFEVSKLELSKDMPITQKEIDTLAAYPSITYIRCYLHQLEQMIAVKLQHLNGFNGFCRRMDRIRTEHCEVRVINNIEPELWTAVLDFFEKEVSINAKVFTPLINLSNLRSLAILKTSGNASFRDLFESFASMETHTLEELRVAFLSPEEIAEVAKIRSLKDLECGFFCSRFIDHLAAMPQLEVLTITVHPLGRLRALFKALASRTDQTLRCLIIQRAGLTFEEVVELSRIESLLGFELGLLDKQDWQHSPNHRTGNQYVRYCQKCQLPPRGSDHVQHRICTKSLPFLPHETGFDTQVRFLTELYETSTPLNLNLLANLPRLRWLSIHIGHSIPAVENLLRTLALEAPKRLHKILFGSQDFKLMSQFEELKYLECFFYHIRDIDSVGLLRNLRELSLYNPHGIDMWPILRELRELPYLDCLIVNGKDLDNYEIAAVVNIKTLTRLRVGLASNEWFKYLILAKELVDLDITSIHYANENDVDYINLICMKCTKLKTFSIYRYFGYITKEKVGELVDTLKSVRDPAEIPYLLLRGIWVDFERL
ncbi:hypothetical protein KR054_005617, partial [Drosophila jambulina]